MAYKHTKVWRCVHCKGIQATRKDDTYSCGYCPAKSDRVNHGKRTR